MANRHRNPPVVDRPAGLDKQRNARGTENPKRALSQQSGGRPRLSLARTKALKKDVTERTQSEELLREAQRRTESILASVTDTHIVFDRQWHYAYVNDAAVRAIGRAREQIIGRTLWEVFPDIVGTEIERQYRRAMDERVTVVFEFHYLTLDSWWDNRFNPVPEGLAVFATDITERKRAEAERAQLAAIVRSSDDAIIAETLDGIILSWNQGAVRMYRLYGRRDRRLSNL